MSQAGKFFDGTALADIETLTGNAGGAVGPDGTFDIDIIGVANSGITVTGIPASNELNIAMLSPFYGVFEFSDTGAAKVSHDLLTLTNRYNNADMDGTGAALKFDLWYSDGTPAVWPGGAGRISVISEQDALVGVATQDSSMSFQTALNGTLSNGMTLTSTKRLGIGIDAPLGMLHATNGTGSIIVYQNAGVNSNTIISENTTDGSDNRALVLFGGGFAGAAYETRGSYIELNGNERVGKGGVIRNICGRIAGSYQNWYTGSPVSEQMRLIADGKLGIGTTAPDLQLEINNATGQCLRLTYNDADGGAAVYTDYTVSAAGVNTITPTGGQVSITNTGVDDLLTMEDAAANIDIQLNTGGDSYFNGGNVAIGSTTPLVNMDLDVTGKIRSTDALFVDELWNGAAPEWATDVTTGSVAAQARQNGWLRLTTGATATNEESLDWGDITVCLNTLRPTIEVRLDLEEVSDTEVEVGLKESEAVGTDDYIMIAFDPSAQATWYLEASSGGTATTDQGATADTNEVLLRFEFTSDTALEWFIDGVSQGVVATNVPTVALQPFIRIRTEANAAHYIDVDFFKIYQDRA